MVPRIRWGELVKGKGYAEMLGLIYNEPNHYLEGLASPIRNLVHDFSDARSLVFFGLGGSGIVGKVAAAFSEEFADRPIFAITESRLPRWVRREDLIVFVSYSGETLEVLGAVRESLRLGLRPVIITSGGKLLEIARDNKIPFVKVIEGLPPRMASPYMIGSALKIIEDAGIRNVSAKLEKATAHLQRLRDKLSPESEEGNVSKEIALHLVDGLPHTFASWPLSIGAYRFKTQLNENAKTPCILHEVPESMHNELEALPFTPQDRYVIFRAFHEPRDVAIQLDHIRSNHEERTLEVRTDGDPLLSTIMIADYASIYLAAIKGVDPILVSKIRNLRKALKEGMSEEAP